MSGPDINQSLSRRNLDPIHVTGQFERLVDFGVGIKRQEEILYQKIERAPVTASPPISTLSRCTVALPCADRMLARTVTSFSPLNQLRHQPIGLRFRWRRAP